MLKVVYKRDQFMEEKTESFVLKILAYFSIFRYPVSRDEILKFLPPAADESLVDDALTNLLAHKSIFRIDDWYLLEDDSSLVLRRREGNIRAERLLVTARKVGKFISKFPYVRGIGISGSLSKNYADEKADIDFFVITKANRLWIAWAFMHLFKKLTFLVGKQNFFCMNYYVDETAMALEDRNIYTAMEIFTLVPVEGEQVQDFFAANHWAKEWFANYSSTQAFEALPGRRPLLKKLVELLFNGRFGDRIDSWLMKSTDKRWKRKTQRRQRNNAGRIMTLITHKHFCKSNPEMFSEKVLAAYEKKVADLRVRWPGYFLETYSHTALV